MASGQPTPAPVIVTVGADADKFNTDHDQFLVAPKYGCGFCFQYMLVQNCGMADVPVV